MPPVTNPVLVGTDGLGLAGRVTERDSKFYIIYTRVVFYVTPLKMCMIGGLWRRPCDFDVSHTYDPVAHARCTERPIDYLRRPVALLKAVVPLQRSTHILL